MNQAFSVSRQDKRKNSVCMFAAYRSMQKFSLPVKSGPVDTGPEMGPMNSFRKRDVGVQERLHGMGNNRLALTRCPGVSLW